MYQRFEEPMCEKCDSRMDSIFAQLKDKELQDLSLNKGCNFYQKEQQIFYEGNRPTGLFCIHRGKVKLAKLGDEGRDRIVRFAGKGDVLGYRSLISGENYKGTATALEDCIACFIPKSLFFDILEKRPELSLRLMRIFSNDLRSAEDRLTNLTQNTVKERLAESILVLNQTFGTNERGFIDIQLTRSDMSKVIGTTTETVIRLLSEMNKERILNVKGRDIKILDKDRLVQLAKTID